MGDQISIPTSDGEFMAYRAAPRAWPAPTVVVLQELFGVNADMRQTCDELAELGFIAICPDLFWRQQPGTDLDVRSEADWQKGLALYGAFDRDLGVRDVADTVRFGKSIRGASGRIGLLGYCLGGLMTFLSAARNDVDAAVAFHGADTEKYLGEARNINAPVLMHLAGEDEFMPAAARHAITATLSEMPIAQVFTYEGCQHAFTRHNGVHFDAEAAALANRRTHTFLTAMLQTYPKPGVDASGTSSIC